MPCPSRGYHPRASGPGETVCCTHLLSLLTTKRPHDPHPHFWRLYTHSAPLPVSVYFIFAPFADLVTHRPALSRPHLSAIGLSPLQPLQYSFSWSLSRDWRMGQQLSHCWDSSVSSATPPLPLLASPLPPLTHKQPPVPQFPLSIDIVLSRTHWK